MAFLIKAIGGLTALVLLVVTLLGSLITLGGFLLSAVKVLIVVVFFAVLLIVGLSLLRSRSHRRNTATDF